MGSQKAAKAGLDSQRCQGLANAVSQLAAAESASLTKQRTQASVAPLTPPLSDAERGREVSCSCWAKEPGLLHCWEPVRNELTCCSDSQIHANCRIRRVYFSDRLYSEDELPAEFKLYLPVQNKAKVRQPWQGGWWQQLGQAGTPLPAPAASARREVGVESLGCWQHSQP